MTTSTAAKLPAIVASDPIGSILAQRGFSVRRVDPVADSKSTAYTEQQLDDLLLTQLEEEGFSDPNQAFRAIAGVFGIGAYADKNQLAAEGTPFYIHEIVQRIEGAFDSKHDDWALKIAIAETGEAQTLCLESWNAKTGEPITGRNRFLYLTAYAIAKCGNKPILAMLTRIEKKDGTAFFIVGPASLGPNNLRHAARSVETIEHGSNGAADRL